MEIPAPIRRLLDMPLIAAWRRGDGLPSRLHLILGLIIPLWILIVNMWRVHYFTVDDSYISYRYAENLANGLGLVYNPGEKIEGYTNFLFVIIMAGGIKLGIDPHISSKLMGSLSSIGTMIVVYKMANRLLPYKTLPCVATWLLAGSACFSGYAVLGLETNMFGFLVLLGTFMMFKEHERGTGFPWSGVVFAAAGLMRPEAPLFAGTPMLLLGRKFFSKQNLIRGFVFAGPVVAHLLWRFSYYGEWTPATLAAKTGDMKMQYRRGKGYIFLWLDHAGPVVFMSMYGLGVAIARKCREGLTLALVFVLWCGYIMLEGGDWMSYYRFMAKVEPFPFLLVGLGFRHLAESRKIAPIVFILLFGTWCAVDRLYALEEAQNKWLKEEKKFWDNAAGQVADWLAVHGTYGRVALGDIGYVGYRTKYPILDLLGLVDPVISQLKGGYTKKLGKGFKERFYELEPAYAVLIMKGQKCEVAGMEGAARIFNDKRFLRKYEAVHNVQVISGASWCIFERKDHR